MCQRCQKEVISGHFRPLPVTPVYVQNLLAGRCHPLRKLAGCPVTGLDRRGQKPVPRPERHRQDLPRMGDRVARDPGEELLPLRDARGEAGKEISEPVGGFAHSPQTWA